MLYRWMSWQCVYLHLVPIPTYTHFSPFQQCVIIFKQNLCFQTLQKLREKERPRCKGKLCYNIFPSKHTYRSEFVSNFRIRTSLDICLIDLEKYKCFIYWWSFIRSSKSRIILHIHTSHEQDKCVTYMLKLLPFINYLRPYIHSALCHHLTTHHVYLLVLFRNQCCRWNIMWNKLIALKYLSYKSQVTKFVIFKISTTLHTWEIP